MKASHFIGGQIEYFHQGGGQYEIVVSSYWEDPDSFSSLFYYDSTGANISNNVVVDVPFYTENQSTLLNGTIEVIQKSLVTFTSSNVYYISTNNKCCRINGGGNFSATNFDLQTSINYNASSSCGISSSPEFFDNPTFLYPPDANLSFSLNLAQSTEFSYNFVLAIPSGLSGNIYDDLTDSGFTLNQDGTVIWTNPIIGIWLITVEIQEVCNNIPTGSFIQRDFILEINANASNNSPPICEEIDTIFANIGDYISFQYEVLDSNNNNILLNANGLPLSSLGASFTTISNQPGMAIGQFEWDTEDEESGIFSIQIAAIDDAFPAFTCQEDIVIVLEECSLFSGGLGGNSILSNSCLPIISSVPSYCDNFTSEISLEFSDENCITDAVLYYYFLTNSDQDIILAIQEDNSNFIVSTSGANYSIHSLLVDTTTAISLGTLQQFYNQNIVNLNNYLDNSGLCYYLDNDGVSFNAPDCLCQNNEITIFDIISPTPNQALCGTINFEFFNDCSSKTTDIILEVDGITQNINYQNLGEGNYIVPFNLNSLSEGSKTFSFTATTSDGQEVTESVDLTVNCLGPPITITSPNTGDILDANSNVTITTNFDPNDPPASVTFEIIHNDPGLGNSTILGTDSSPPFTGNFNTTGFGGSVQIVVVATDQYGLLSDADVITVAVDIPTSLEFIDVIGYENTFVNPIIGTPDDIYFFSIDYFANPGVLPISPPILEMDFDGDGQFNDIFDLSYTMLEADPSDTDPSDGKRYAVTVTGLAVNIWDCRISVTDNEATYVEEVVNNEPKVTNDVLDIAIYADNIQFSELNPDAGEEFLVTITITNTSDFPASQFVVEIYEDTETLGTLLHTETVSGILPQSTTTFSFPLTFPEDDYVPIKVLIDTNNDLPESNELNNTAIRPIVIGDYVVAGSIDLTNVKVSPNCVYPEGTTCLTGLAEYADLAVDGIELDVAGAAVYYSITELGTSLSGVTTSTGNLYACFTAPLSPGTYHIEGYVTDFTLTSEFGPIEFKVVEPPQLPDLTSSVSIINNDCKYTEGEVITGQVRVYNDGVIPAENFNVTLKDCNGTQVLQQSIAFLDVDEEIFFNYSYTLGQAGYCFLQSFADSDNEVFELKEYNNKSKPTFYIRENQPDLTIWGNFFENYNIQYYVGDNGNFSLNIANTGGASSTQNINLTYTITFPDGNMQSFNNSFAEIPFTGCDGSLQEAFNFTFNQEGEYTIVAELDPTNNISEISEDNNTYESSIYVSPPPPPPPPVPNLTFRWCQQYVNGVSVERTDNPNEFLVQFELVNNGTQDINNSFSLSAFVIDNVTDNAIEFLTTITSIASGETIDVSIPITVNPLGNYDLEVYLDSFDEVDESKEYDNQDTYPLCVDLRLGNYCYFFNNFHQNNIYVDVPFNMNLALYNTGHLDADVVNARYTIFRNGNQIDELIDSQNDVNSMKCKNCPYTIGGSLGYIFYDTGEYEVCVELDYDNQWVECDEGNNVECFLIDVLEPLPDLEILSQYINPSNLNPQDASEQVTIDVTVTNVGYGNSDGFDVECLVDDIPLGSVSMPGIEAGEEHTEQIPQTWSSSDSGAHIIRCFVDQEDLVSELLDISNNEASRAIIVGEATNLYFSSFEFSNPLPQVGEEIQLMFTVENEGSLEASGQVQITVYENGEIAQTILLDPFEDLPIFGQPNNSISYTVPFTVNTEQTIFEISLINTSPAEFNYQDNTINQTLETFTIEITDVQNTICNEADNGSATVEVLNGGTPPFTYEWTPIGGDEPTGSNLLAGNYQVIVTDADGFQAVTPVTIESDGGDCGMIENYSGTANNITLSADTSQLVYIPCANCEIELYYSNSLEPIQTTQANTDGEFTFENLYEVAEYDIAVKLPPNITIISNFYSSKKIRVKNIDNISIINVPLTLAQIVQKKYDALLELNMVKSLTLLNSIQELINGDAFKGSIYLDDNFTNLFRNEIITSNSGRLEFLLGRLFIIEKYLLLGFDKSEKAVSTGGKSALKAANNLVNLALGVKNNLTKESFVSIQDLGNSFVNNEDLNADLVNSLKGILSLIMKNIEGFAELNTGQEWTTKAYSAAIDSWEIISKKEDIGIQLNRMGIFEILSESIMIPAANYVILQNGYISKYENYLNEYSEVLVNEAYPFIDLTYKLDNVLLRTVKEFSNNLECDEAEQKFNEGRYSETQPSFQNQISLNHSIIELMEKYSDCRIMDAKNLESNALIVEDVAVTADLVAITSVVVSGGTSSAFSGVLLTIAKILEVIESTVLATASVKSFRTYNHVRRGIDKVLAHEILPNYVTQNSEITALNKGSISDCSDFFDSTLNEISSSINELNIVYSDLNLHISNSDTIKMLESLEALYNLDSIHRNKLERAYIPVYRVYNESMDTSLVFENQYDELILQPSINSSIKNEQVKLYLLSHILNPSNQEALDSLLSSLSIVTNVNNNLVNTISQFYDNIKFNDCKSLIQLININDSIIGNNNSNSFLEFELINYDNIIYDTLNLPVLIYNADEIIIQDTILLLNLSSDTTIQYAYDASLLDSIAFYSVNIIDGDDYRGIGYGGTINKIFDNEIDCNSFPVNPSHIILNDTIFDFGDTLIATNQYDLDSIMNTWYINGVEVSNDSALIYIVEETDSFELTLHTQYYNCEFSTSTFLQSNFLCSAEMPLDTLDLKRKGALFGITDFPTNGNEVYTWFDSSDDSKVAQFVGNPYYSPSVLGSYYLIVTDPDFSDCFQVFGPRIIDALNGCCELEEEENEEEDDNDDDNE